MAVYKVHDAVSFGIEYYTDLGPFSAGFLPWSEEEHYLFEVLNQLAVEHLELNAGIGEGLTEASNRLIFKMILGYSWEKDAVPAPQAAMRLRAGVALTGERRVRGRPSRWGSYRRGRGSRR